MIKNTSYNRFYEIYLGIFVFFALVFPKLIAFAFIGFLPLIIVGYLKKKISFKVNLLSILFIAFYLIYLIYAIFTRHPDLASRYFENKLSFILIPILLSFRIKNRISWKAPILVFLFSILILLSQSYFVAFSCYFGGEKQINCFFSSLFSFQHHPTYTAVYLLLASAFSLCLMKDKGKYLNKKWIIPAIIFLIFSYFLCLSLAGILFMFLLISVLFIRFIYLKFGKFITLLSIVVTPVIIFLVINFVPKIEGEYYNAKWHADKFMENPSEYLVKQKEPLEGTQVRLCMWIVATQVFSDFPMGVGTGNVDEVLGFYLKKSKQYELAKKEYNPHNQYLQTAVETGVFGLFILIALIFTAVYYSIKNKNWILLTLILNLAFNMIFESMLQRQDGIVFYTFFLNLLAIYPISMKISRESLG